MSRALGWYACNICGDTHEVNLNSVYFNLKICPGCILKELNIVKIFKIELTKAKKDMKTELSKTLKDIRKDMKGLKRDIKKGIEKDIKKVIEKELSKTKIERFMLKRLRHLLDELKKPIRMILYR